MKLAFVEDKAPCMARVAKLLENSAEQNAWANRGPLYRMLGQVFSDHIGLSEGQTLVPMANGGVALEAMARLRGARAGRKLRWVASTYSFQNLGRGYFSDITFVDCDAGGRLDVAALSQLDPESYDGVIATNPFGLFADFSALADFAQKNGKSFLIDNASGVHTAVPDVSWQAFSLHHTKPYGMGEGGFALVPAGVEEELYALINYGADLGLQDREHWFGNGKLSDISCAFLIDRLEQFSNWGPRYLQQRERVIRIASRCGLVPIKAPETDIAMTSMPFLYDKAISLEAVDGTQHATFAKYYRPLADLPCGNDLYDRLVNIPCHGDVETLSDDQLEADILACIGPVSVARQKHSKALPDSEGQGTVRKGQANSMRRAKGPADGAYRAGGLPPLRS